ncbi:hypothetical protein HMPREF0578_1876 [Mobiluncus mulieris 28-1]|nr:hypothetical protein [Mobiluncus mulieris]EEZ90875.1 hypothetical protein HMPREF0578_1876 [Mobiluncus mulieris 28-1]MBB5845763.1 hypothetical protein [Mobiluncus mulieris]
METEFMVAATVTGVTPMVLQEKFGVARRSGRRWIAGLTSAPP